MPRHGGGGGGSGTCCVEWWRASSRPGDVILGGHMSLGYADLLRGASLCNDSPAFIRVQNASGEQDDPLFRNFPSCTLPEGTSKSFSYFFFMLSPHLRLSLQARNKKKLGILSMNAILMVFGCPTAHPGYSISRNYTTRIFICICI